MIYHSNLDSRLVIDLTGLDLHDQFRAVLSSWRRDHDNPNVRLSVFRVDPFLAELFGL